LTIYHGKTEKVNTFLLYLQLFLIFFIKILVEAFPKLWFLEGNPGFSGKNGLRTAFSIAFPVEPEVRTGRVLGKARYLPNREANRIF
jgi:hypothetical protein